MAANLKTRGIANLGKQLICNQLLWTGNSISNCSNVLSPAVLTLKRRTLHTSFYEKNIDDLAHHVVVPDEVIQPQSDKYWAPHPQTGVFGPAAAQPGTATEGSGEHSSHSSLAAATANASGSDNTDSVLEHKAWFRPTSIEDLEKPHHLHL